MFVCSKCTGKPGEKKKKNDGLTVLNFHFSKETKSFSVCSSKVTIVSLVVSQDFWKQIPKSNPWLPELQPQLNFQSHKKALIDRVGPYKVWWADFSDI